MIVQCGLSSMNSFASPSRPTACATRVQSSSRNLPVQRRLASTLPSIASRRLVSSSVPISIEKKTTGRPVCVATLPRHTERKAGLADAGPRREDDEVRRLEPVEDAVDLVVARGHADEIAVVAVPALEVVESVLERVVDADHRVGDGRSATSNTSDSARSSVSVTSSGTS